VIVSKPGYKLLLVVLELLVLDMVVTGFEAYRAARTETFDEIYRKQITSWPRTQESPSKNGSKAN
jgi:hypothetical protein